MLYADPWDTCNISFVRKLRDLPTKRRSTAVEIVYVGGQTGYKWKQFKKNKFLLPKQRLEGVKGLEGESFIVRSLHVLGLF